jgi:glucose-1-phosphate thymidylyltransferase
MEIAKAIVMAGARRDDRPWPTVAAGAKHLFPVANSPILFHNLEALRQGGLLEAMIVVDSGAGDAIARAVGDGSRWGLAVRCVEQAPDAGLIGTLAVCRAFVGDEPVLVQQGDAILRERMHPHIATFSRDRLDAMALRLLAPGARGRRGALPGYLLSARALEILMERPEAAANPLKEIRAFGGRVRVQRVDACLPCDGEQRAVLECNRRMLDVLECDFSPASLHASEIQGRVVIDPTARLKRTTVRGPAIIGPGTTLTDAYVGPYTAIGANVVVEGAEIEHSIVLDGAELRFVGSRVESSVIGAGARIVREFKPPSALRMTLGAGAEVMLS